MRTAFWVLVLTVALTGQAEARSRRARQLPNRPNRAAATRPQAPASTAPLQGRNVQAASMIATPASIMPSSSGKSSGSSPKSWGNFGRTLTTPQTDTQPPESQQHVSVPGALIRTEGLGFKTGPGGPISQQPVEAGRIVAEEGRSQYLYNHKGAYNAPPEKLPTATPAGKTASGRTGVFEVDD